MKTVLATLAFVVLASGCASMSERQKQWTGALIGVVVVGAIAAHNGGSAMPAGSPGTVGPAPSCSMQPDGSCR